MFRKNIVIMILAFITFCACEVRASDFTERLALKAAQMLSKGEIDVVVDAAAPPESVWKKVGGRRSPIHSEAVLKDYLRETLGRCFKIEKAIPIGRGKTQGACVRVLTADELGDVSAECETYTFATSTSWSGKTLSVQVCSVHGEPPWVNAFCAEGDDSLKLCAFIEAYRVVVGEWHITKNGRCKCVCD